VARQTNPRLKGAPSCQGGVVPASWLVIAEAAVYTGPAVRTYSPKASEIRHDWHEVDASGAVLGRLASEVARVLRGKHKATFAPHLDTGDYVVVVNAGQVVLSAGKGEKKFHYRYSGYPGGIRSRSYADMLAKRPEEVVRLAVRGMLPKGPLGRQMLRKLKVYAGPEHPHAAQRPAPLALDHSAHRVA
jgi:large subunit ribosomal protein L13